MLPLSKPSWTVSVEQMIRMALADDIRALRDRVLADLNGAYDYYTDTKIAWDILVQVIAAGHTFSIRNMTTGTVTTQADLTSKARGYVAEQLAEATFQQFISIFQNFFLDLLRFWLTAYPQSLSGKKVDFQAILDAPDKDAITLQECQSCVRPCSERVFQPLIHRSCLRLRGYGPERHAKPWPPRSDRSRLVLGKRVWPCPPST